MFSFNLITVIKFMFKFWISYFSYFSFPSFCFWFIAFEMQWLVLAFALLFLSHGKNSYFKSRSCTQVAIVKKFWYSMANITSGLVKKQKRKTIKSETHIDVATNHSSLYIFNFVLFINFLKYLLYAVIPPH